MAKTTLPEDLGDVGHEEGDVPALAGFRMPADVAADLYVDRMLSQDPDARDFAHPFWWGAFAITGA